MPNLKLAVVKPPRRHIGVVQEIPNLNTSDLCNVLERRFPGPERFQDLRPSLHPFDALRPEQGMGQLNTGEHFTDRQGLGTGGLRFQRAGIMHRFRQCRHGKQEQNHE